MEPIFNDNKFRGNLSAINNCQLFIAGTSYFFAHPKNRTLENAYYHFGLMFDSLHFERNKKWKDEIFRPVKEFFPGVIETELLLAIQLGKDNDFEYNELEADKYDPYYWRIKKAAEQTRADWAFFMFLGNIQGLFNGNRITKERFLQYLSFFPEKFIKKNKENIQCVFNFFDERGYLLAINKAITLSKVGPGLYPEIENNDSPPPHPPTNPQTR